MEWEGGEPLMMINTQYAAVSPHVRISHDFVREKPIVIIRDLISKFSIVGKPRPSASNAPSKHVTVSQNPSIIDYGY